MDTPLLDSLYDIKQALKNGPLVGTIINNGGKDGVDGERMLVIGEDPTRMGFLEVIPLDHPNDWAIYQVNARGTASGINGWPWKPYLRFQLSSTPRKRGVMLIESLIPLSQADLSPEDREGVHLSTEAYFAFDEQRKKEEQQRKRLDTKHRKRLIEILDKSPILTPSNYLADRMISDGLSSAIDDVTKTIASMEEALGYLKRIKASKG